MSDMQDYNKKAVLEELEQIPGVGKKMAVLFYDSGIGSIRELKNKDPEKLYLELCKRKGCHIDRCVLYTFRCAVYFASHRKHDPELLKWWNWKD